jgi:DNA-binding transcriptional LysR family regulator
MLVQLRSFLVVVEEGSLNRAAVRLRISQPALSRQMQALEAEVGGRLLERTTAGVSPTDAGHALAASIRPVLADYDSAIAEARRLARGQREQLRVGYLVSAAQTYLNPALSALRRTHPEVKVKLLDLSPGEQIAALRAGEIDVAIIGQEGCLAARDFYTRKLATLPIVAVLPADHRLASRKKIRLEELRGERFIASPEDQMPGRDRWITQLCRKAGFKPNFAHVAASVSHMLSLVSGEGTVTLVPAYMKSLPTAGVAMVPISDPGAVWDFLVVWQRGRTGELVRAFIDALSAEAGRA